MTARALDFSGGPLIRHCVAGSGNAPPGRAGANVHYHPRGRIQPELVVCVCQCQGREGGREVGLAPAGVAAGPRGLRAPSFPSRWSAACCSGAAT